MWSNAAKRDLYHSQFGLGSMLQVWAERGLHNVCCCVSSDAGMPDVAMIHA